MSNSQLIPTDEELMRLYLRGESNAFDELYKRHSGRVYSYLLRALGNRQNAEEVHQAVFLKFHNSRNSYDFKYAVLQWLFVISKSAILDFYRKQKREVPIHGRLSNEALENIHAPVSQTVDAPSLDSVEGLSAEQRKVIEWRYMEDLSFEEISRKLGKSQDGVRQMLSRAIKKLRSALIEKGSGA